MLESARHELVEAADANLVTHFTYVQSQTSGMRVSAEQDLVLTDCGLPCDTFNAALRARLHPPAAITRVRAAVEFFAKLQHPFSWWTGPADQPANLGVLLTQAGLEPAESELAMVADLDGLNVPHFPTGLEIRRARTFEDVRAFARVNAANWSPPDELVERFYERAGPLLLTEHSPLWLYIGYFDGAPVATAQLTVGGGVVGLYNIATLRAMRGRGFGTAMTLKPLLDARIAGFRTAILQAAPDGVGIYRRAGFEQFGVITEYKPTA